MLASSSLNIGRASVGCSRCAQQKAVATVVPVASRRLVNVPVQHETVARFDVACAAKSKASSGGKGFGASSKQSQPSAEPNQPCPCGSGATYGACCCPFHLKEANVQTPEQLLRSRYTAYALKLADYIADTTDPESQEYQGTRTAYLQSVRATMRRAEWKGLEIQSTEQGSGPDEAFINFKAYFTDNTDKDGGKQSRVEKSRFVKNPKTKRWMYAGSEKNKPSASAPAATPSLLPSLKLPELKF